MRGGNLRERVTIQSLSTSKDTGGAVTKTWADLATVWAGREELKGGERWAAAQTQHETTVRYRIRYYSGITTKMRLVHGSVAYDIEAVLDADSPARGREMILMCTERSEGA